MPEVPLQLHPPNGAVEQRRESVSSLQAGEEGQEEPPQEDTLDPKAAVRRAPSDKLLENGTPRQACCMSSKQAIVLPSANHPLGAAGHPASPLPSTQVFITSMSSPAHRLHPQGMPGSRHGATATSSMTQAAAILALH